MNEILYVGSTSLNLQKLETNHRNARAKEYTMTKFRTALERDNEMKFEWLVYPAMRTECEILLLEERLINKYLPRYNECYNVLGMKEKVDSTHKMRGVYAATVQG